jgi:hypothetical protein
VQFGGQGAEIGIIGLRRGNPFGMHLFNGALRLGGIVDRQGCNHLSGAKQA